MVTKTFTYVNFILALKNLVRDRDQDLVRNKDVDVDRREKSWNGYMNDVWHTPLLGHLRWLSYGTSLRDFPPLVGVVNILSKYGDS